MAQCIAVRGPNGVALFVVVPFQDRTTKWTCSRNDFSIARTSDPAGLVAVLAALVQHAQLHTGTISQLVQLDL